MPQTFVLDDTVLLTSFCHKKNPECYPSLSRIDSLLQPDPEGNWIWKKIKLEQEEQGDQQEEDHRDRETYICQEYKRLEDCPFEFQIMTTTGFRRVKSITKQTIPFILIYSVYLYISLFLNHFQTRHLFVRSYGQDINKKMSDQLMTGVL